jgi:nucleotidyltransferase/DNA polymerase involved in DNA repair
MRLLCLVFPRLGIQLARREDPALAGRPTVLLAGDGEAALVAIASVEATAAGIETGMTAAQARDRCPAVTVARDNAGECLDELERIASILRARATTDVAIVSRDAVIVSLGGLEDRFADEMGAAAALARLARSWTGLDVRAGAAGTVDGAIAAARTARRFPVVCPSAGSGQALPMLSGSIAGSVRWGVGASVAEASARLEKLLAKLETAVEVHGLSFREVTIELTRPSGALAYRLRSESPLHRAAEARELILDRLGSGALSGTTGIEVALGRMGPSVRVEPWRPAVAKVHALAGPAVPIQRHLQLAS